MKPYLKIIIIAVVIIIAGLAIYFIWNWLTAAPAAPSGTAGAPYFPLAGLTSTSTGAGTAATSSGAIAVGALVKVSDRPVSFFWTDPATQEVFYLDQNGVVWQAEAGQKNPQITQQGVAAVNFIKQSPDNKSILAAFGDPRLPSWGIYDSVDQVWQPLPSNIIQAAWGADSNTLIATEQNGSSVNLVTLDLTKTPPKPKVLVNDFRLLDTQLAFIPPNTLLVEEKSNVNYGSRIWSFNTKTLAINLLMGPMSGLTARLTSDGLTLLTYSGSSGFQILQSQTLQNLAPLPFVTLPEKCSINSGATIYCFVPTNAGFKSAVLPDDYVERKVYTADVLYGINTGTGAATILPLSGHATGNLDAEKPALAGSNLYFINRFDGYLYALGGIINANPATPPNSSSTAPNGEFYD
jgi:hypothetical protein